MFFMGETSTQIYRYFSLSVLKLVALLKVNELLF